MRIFLINDETIVFKTIFSFLHQLGYSLQVLNASQELYLHNPEPGDIMIVDILDLNKGHFALLKRVTQEYSFLRLLVLIDKKPPFNIEEALSYGIVSYLRKPLYLNELELVLYWYHEFHGFKQSSGDKHRSFIFES